MNRSEMLKLMHKFYKLFNILNKHFYIIPILSYLSSIRNNKFFKSINNILKIIILINIILGVSFIILFTDFVIPFNITYSIYYDLIDPYIEIIKHLFYKKNYINSLINNINASAGPVNN